MSSKKKLVISLSVAAAVLVAAIIAIVAVFAAAQQTIASNVKVTFRATNVDCAVEASYTTNTVKDKQVFKTLTIEAEDGGSVAKEANLPNVDLIQGGENGVFITLSYNITNTSSRPMLVKLAELTDNSGNWDITLSHSGLTSTGVEIDGKIGETVSNEIFTITIKATTQAIQSAEDVPMDITLNWTLTATSFSA